MLFMWRLRLWLSRKGFLPSPQTSQINASFRDEEGGDGCKGEKNLSHLLSLFVSLSADLGLVGGSEESLLTMELVMELTMELTMELVEIVTEGHGVDDSTLFADVWTSLPCD